MTENQIKEAISVNYIQTIVNRIGHKVDSRHLDHGVDLNIIEVEKIDRNGTNRYLDSGRSVECQLKATTENRVNRTTGVIKYPLEVKTYNDLIHRINKHLPLVLVLFILPDDDSKWVVCNNEKLIIEKHAYWYMPAVGSLASTNINNITIDIPESQLIDEKTFPYLFDFVYNTKGTVTI